MKTPISEVEPACHLIVDGKPPSGSIWMISRHGAGFAGHWFDGCGAAAWSPLPKMPPEMKARLLELESQGIDVTRPL